MTAEVKSFRCKKWSSFFYITFISCFLFVRSNAQEGTRITNENIKGKVMIIPFEPLMYMSEIDKKVNEKTNWNFDQIREKFRRELDLNLLFKLKPKTPVISFYMDSIKMANDLDFIYKSRSLSYDLVEPSKTASAAKPQKAITNGQLTVEINNDSKFMNANITNPTLLSYLSKKYGSEYFVFINELDIKYDMNSYDMATDSYQREVKVHYTIMDKSKKIISAGIASAKLSSEENVPKKIVEKSFIPIVDYISNQLVAFLNVKDKTDKK